MALNLHNTWGLLWVGLPGTAPSWDKPTPGREVPHTCWALPQGVDKLSFGDCQSFWVRGRLGTHMSVQLTFLLCANLMDVEYLVVRILFGTAKKMLVFLAGSSAGHLLLSA